MMTKRSFLGTGLLAGVAATLLMAAPASAQYKAEYKLSVVANKPVLLSESAFRWADLINERTGGRINVKVYPGSSLVGGDQSKELVSMRQGAIDMLVSSTINISGAIKEMNLFSLPFLFPDNKAFDAIIQGDVGKDLFKTLEDRGIVPLAWGENGFREISNSVKAVRTPDDMKGLKFRVVGSPIFNEIFTVLGANPTQMSFADLQPALSTGAVSGQENPVSLFLATKMANLNQKYLTVWNYTADAALFHMNKAVWDSWKPEDQAIVRDAALQAAKELLAASRKGLDGDMPILKELEAVGVKTEVLTVAEKQVFAEKTKAVYDKWKKTIGEELVTKAEKAIAAR